MNPDETGTLTNDAPLGRAGNDVIKMYRAGDDEDSTLLRESMRTSINKDGSPVFTPAVAVSLMIFFALCSQCMSTLAIIQRELNSIKWPIFVFVYMTVLAYLTSLGFYQLKDLFI